MTTAADRDPTPAELAARARRRLLLEVAGRAALAVGALAAIGFGLGAWSAPLAWVVVGGLVWLELATAGRREPSDRGGREEE